MNIFDSARFRFRRWAQLREAESHHPSVTAEERAEIGALHTEFRALPVAPTVDVSENEADWNGAMNRLRELGSTADPRAFQRWDVIIARMAHVGSPATPVELAQLQADDQWESRWRSAIREVGAGSPILFPSYMESSEVLIQTAYHVMRLERLAERPIDSWDVLVEFGGGFGGLCRLAHALGFCGRYLIYDLEPFSILQRYYLRHAHCGPSARITLTSDFEVLEEFVNGVRGDEEAVFWATWSLSETPVSFRERIMPLAERLRAYSIAYQGTYGDVDNRAYFTEGWLRGERRDERIPHRRDDYYEVGRVG